MRNLILSQTRNFFLRLPFQLQFMEMRTLVAIKSDIFSQTPNTTVIYRPDLASKDPTELEESFKKYQPNYLVVGANEVNANSLKIWRENQQEIIGIARRGTSMANIDLEAARNLGILVENTPAVNSIHVAKYINEILSEEPSSKITGLIGFGKINSLVAEILLKNGSKVITYSPTSFKAMKIGMTFSNGISPAKSIADLITKADNIVIAADISKFKTRIITAQDLLSVKYGQKKNIICISEPEVFDDQALKLIADLANKNYLKILFDNSPKSMTELQIKMEKYGYQDKGIKFSSKAMSSTKCQRDMDIAVLSLMVKNAVKYRLPQILNIIKDENIKLNDITKSVKIVGAGISGMITALYFHEQGYNVTIFDQAPDFKTNQDFLLQGISRRTFDARHLSTTETITHANSDRIKKWFFDKIQDPNYFEKIFQKNFAGIGENPDLLAIMQKAVAEINYVALNDEYFGWQYLKSKYPLIFEQNIFGPGKMLRIFYNEQDLDKAYELQKLTHKEDDGIRKLGKSELAKLYPGHLANLVSSGVIEGAIEVPGYGLRIISLCQEIENFLPKKSIKWQHKISRTDDEILFDKKDNIVISTGSTPITWQQNSINKVYGLFISIANIDGEGFKDPIKIHAPEPIGVINVTPSQDGLSLYISGGFQYFGHQNSTEKELDNLFSELEKRVQEFFPKGYEIAVQNQSLNKKYCPRPMTSSGFIQFITSEEAIIIGGTNSGGAVLSPLLAQLALLKTELDHETIKGETRIKLAELLEIVEFSLTNLNKIDSMPKISPQPLKISSLLPKSEQKKLDITRHD